MRRRRIPAVAVVAVALVAALVVIELLTNGGGSEPAGRAAPALPREVLTRPRVTLARAFIRHYGWTFPNLRDASGTVGNNFGLSGLPNTFVLDSHGRIKKVLIGPQTVASFEQALRTVE